MRSRRTAPRAPGCGTPGEPQLNDVSCAGFFARYAAVLAARNAAVLAARPVPMFSDFHTFGPVGGLTTPAPSLGAKATLLVPTGGPVHFFLDASNTTHQDELGFFYVDGPDGRITKRVNGDPTGQPLLGPNGQPQYVRPGDPDYAAWALKAANSQPVFTVANGSGSGPTDATVDVPWDGYVAFYVVQNGTAESWRGAPASAKPNVWFSVGGAQQGGFNHFQTTTPRDPAYRPGLLQYRVTDSSSRPLWWLPPSRDSFVFSANIVPFIEDDNYSVLNAGADFQGTPLGFTIDTPGDVQNRGLGLLFNDYDPNGRPLTVTAISLDDETWLPVVDPATHRAQLTITDPQLHGTLTVYPNGGLNFVPDPTDSYWYVVSGTPPFRDYTFHYRATDGIDSSEAGVTIYPGDYNRGGLPDNKHDSTPMYLLDGGGLWNDNWAKFFENAGKDIVLISQYSDFTLGDYPNIRTSLWQSDRQDLHLARSERPHRHVADDHQPAAGQRSADRPDHRGRRRHLVQRWRQSIYQATWAGTRLFTALSQAAASHVAMGGYSAGTAILGQKAYVDLPWDSLTSLYAPEQPYDPRVRLMPQGAGTLPFAGLSNSPSSPLFNIVTDTHFSGNIGRDRMGRMITFTARAQSPPSYGVGIDEDATLLIEQAAGGGWNWTVTGANLYPDQNVYLTVPAAGAHVQTQDHGRLTYEPINVYLLTPGNTVARNLRDILRSAPSYQIRASAGTVYTTANGGDLYGGLA